MFRKLVNVTLVAGLLTGCAEADLIDDGGSTGLGGGAEGNDGEGADTEDGEWMPPDVDDDVEEVPDPQGRIIWVGEVEGDLMVYATLGVEVAARYPSGVGYRIRIDDEGQAMYAQIVDADDEVLDLVRVAKRAPTMYPSGETVLSYCFPFPAVPPVIANCYAPPCPWDEEPGGPGGSWPNCMETSHEGDVVRIVGAIDGTPFGQELRQGVDPVPMFDTPMTFAQSQRIDTVSLVAGDVAALQPELDELDLDCFDCVMLGGWITSEAGACAQLNFGSCANAYWGYVLFEQNCEEACTAG